ncbi:hypothetical protein H8K90_13470 [Winogradskyella echinorum]|uniref:Cellobiose phosphorylase n=1 Tax=Winogradskyella echinorum TaxID=538189 RepID=A0ABR6Y3Z1_9FLAO|nr:hypothetical protein [Winogradskyella echinorum]MBC3847399.1 hypothetical protein [Winogradskyella echinorum]MBC5751747.1 hypothetical protein [Winogradskyella echinorum]
MSKNPIYIGEKLAAFDTLEVKGELVTIIGETYYKISNSDKMRPFFMSLVSNSNHWLFISSNGALTAGRKDANNALFPYYTDDKITESLETTGSKTIVQVHKDGKTFLWEPFSNRYQGVYATKRNLYKNSCGNKVLFEEINEDLGLTFRYQWNTSDQFGFVRKANIINNTNEKVEATILDGIQNILPYGLDSVFQNATSNLIDAYKKCELEADTGIGIFALSAIIVDRAEPSEALKANTVWSTGIENPTHLISALQLDNFRNGKTITQEEDIRAEKGAYFISKDLSLNPEEEKSWMFVANVNQTISAINDISEKIKSNSNLKELIQQDIDAGTRSLLELVGASDGIQLTDDTLRDTRHFANTLFNIMRGGIFDDNYNIEKQDFVKYIAKANTKVSKSKEDILNNLPEIFNVDYIKNIADKDEDSNFKRLCYEYLPLKFSRRHGDPSRPWNKFSINTRSEVDGSKILDYQGNWRDIFQNWETLAHSYPAFMEGMIHKFFNATTFEGYNPYRVTKDGFDWETIEADDPWSYIGYWGDHQIIYLLKFLEFIEKHNPNKLANNFTQDVFVYANVPYKIKSYQDTLKNPKDTIDFDYDLDVKINKIKDRLGADGALLRDQNYFIHKVNLVEKLLATVLAKVSNFIPEGGIWLNTQRPEWNDANNALVGNGVSMVTLYYLRRFIKFFEAIVENASEAKYDLSIELKTFFEAVVNTLNANRSVLSGKVSDKDRKTILDGLGTAGSEYRLQIYEAGFLGDKASISKDDLLKFFKELKDYLDHTIKANKRSDNLYHAYNLMTVENDTEVSISYLSEMLEGQVAVLSSGYLQPKEALSLLDGLKASALFRHDQYSYILYPNKELSRFVDKNIIPAKSVANSKLLTQLISDNNTQIIEKDVTGQYHFNGNFNNADSLKAALNGLPKGKYEVLIEAEKQLLLDIFEEMFDHKSFTGRSGTFYGYEGLGSIYWHMVSKLLLAVQENCLLAVARNESEETIGRLLEHYYEINEGIGVHKSPKLYGAFPTDPYSHTPGGKGAQQPGMTGQVKEDVLCRFGELGVFVTEGSLYFNPRLLRKEEFLSEPKEFVYTAIDKTKKTIQLLKGSLCFTYCQVPIIYQLQDKNSLEVKFNEGSVLSFNELKLDKNISAKIFNRAGEVNQIIVSVKE